MTYKHDRHDCEGHDGFALLHALVCPIESSLGFHYTGLLLFERQELLQLQVLSALDHNPETWNGGPHLLTSPQCSRFQILDLGLAAFNFLNHIVKGLQLSQRLKGIGSNTLLMLPHYAQMPDEPLQVTVSRPDRGAVELLKALVEVLDDTQLLRIYANHYPQLLGDVLGLPQQCAFGVDMEIS